MLVINATTGALEMAVSAGGADDSRVAEAARLIVRAERVAAVRFYVTSHARLLPLITRPETLDQLVAPADEELTPLAERAQLGASVLRQP